jgi:hypothetical protein
VEGPCAQLRGTAPTFPLDLGVEAGQAWPQRVYNRCLLRPEEADAFAAVCKDAGGSAFAGLLACMALAVRAMTGKQEFHTVTPLHTRSRPRWRPAMEWFITCAPLSFSIEGAQSFTEALERAQLSVQDAVRLARYPALRVIELLGEEFRITRRDLFSMVSFTDYRKLPGADRHAESTPVTIGRVTEADDSHADPVNAGPCMVERDTDRPRNRRLDKGKGTARSDLSGRASGRALVWCA